MKKVCSRCKKEKEISNFTYKGNGKYRSECKECRRLEYKNNPEKRVEVLMRAKRYYQEHKEEVKNKSKLRRRESKEKEMWKSAKERATKKNLPFNIEVSDVVIPKECPVLGIPIYSNEKVPTANSPSLDRIIPEKGYVKGNVIVISYKANTIKSNAKVEEIEKVYKFYKKIIDKLKGDIQ